MAQVSALLIIKNEEAFVERALNSLLWCDEIVVVDAHSTDKTKAICTSPNAPWSSKLRFVEQSWLGFAAQRNFALHQAKNEWVFFLDGDEACSSELARKIREVIASNPSAQFKVRRQEYFLKKPIHHGIWNPSQ